jgi:hypothetical protein
MPSCTKRIEVGDRNAIHSLYTVLVKHCCECIEDAGVFGARLFGPMFDFQEADKGLDSIRNRCGSKRLRHRTVGQTGAELRCSFDRQLKVSGAQRPSAMSPILRIVCAKSAFIASPVDDDVCSYRYSF